MASVTAGMTMSLDGFVADRQGSASALYPDLADLQGTVYMNAAIAETGAVVMGRRTFEMADPDSYVGNYEFQVPIFVVTHHPPETAPKQDEQLSFTFVTEGTESAIEQATTAAGEKVVQIVGGPNLIQQLLGAQLVDELHLDGMPVVLGGGCLLENLDPDRVRLDKREVQEIGARTTLRFGVMSARR
jgi:dihydrofolate reductase